MRLFLLLFLIAFPAIAQAGNAPASQSAAVTSGDPLACADNIDEALEKARRALGGNAPGAEHVALVCLLDAVNKLEAAQPVGHRGPDQHAVLAAPQVPAFKFSQ
jgi:hypothetical protein